MASAATNIPITDSPSGLIRLSLLEAIEITVARAVK